MTAQCMQAWWQSPVRRRRLGSSTPGLLRARWSMQRGCFCSAPRDSRHSLPLPPALGAAWPGHWSGVGVCCALEAGLRVRRPAGVMSLHARINHPRGGDTLRPGSARPSALPHWRLRAPVAAPWIRTCIRSPLLFFAVFWGGGARPGSVPGPYHFGRVRGPYQWISARPPEPARRAARQVEGAHACVCAHGAVCGVGYQPYMPSCGRMDGGRVLRRCLARWAGSGAAVYHVSLLLCS